MGTFAQKSKARQQNPSVKPAVASRAHFGQNREMNSVHDLQRLIGNQAVQRMLQTNAEESAAELTGTAPPRFGDDFSRIPIHPPTAAAMQTKLVMNKPGDSYEQEADRIAEQVMRTPKPQVGGEHERLRTERVQASDTGQIAAPHITHEVVRRPGQPLNPAARAFMEPHFGYDFPQVRAYSDAVAERSAQNVNDHAYSVGHSIVFGAGRFAPEMHEERCLIGHELTPVIQQSESARAVQQAPDPQAERTAAVAEARQAPASERLVDEEEEKDEQDKAPVVQTFMPSLEISTPGDPLEREADRIADAVMAPSSTDTFSVAAGAGQVQRACSCDGQDKGSCHCDDNGTVQREAVAGTAEPPRAPRSVGLVISSPGEPLEAPLQRDLEGRFGYDFGSVRVHRDALARQSASQVGARAYTVGRDIAFAAGQYAPDTSGGRRLIAHELVHVIQQTGGSAGLVQRQPDAGAPAGGAPPQSAPAGKTGEPQLQEEQPTGVLKESRPRPPDTVRLIVISCKDMRIRLETADRVYVYKLKTCSLPLGSYKPTVTVTGNAVDLDFSEQPGKRGRFRSFTYDVEPGQENLVSAGGSNRAG